MFVNVGFENQIEANMVVAILRPDSSPSKRLRQMAMEKDLLIDATAGKRTRSVVVMSTGHVVLCQLTNETLKRRIDEARKDALPADVVLSLLESSPSNLIKLKID
jgi:regulator of extracellular matrix RemA (YlzA/DUF370 family)